MSKQRQIIGLHDWMNSPAGRYLTDWEQARLDDVVADIFGFHAVQLGWPGLQALRRNRMPYRWVLSDHPWDPPPLAPTQPGDIGAGVVAEPAQGPPSHLDEPVPLAARTRFDALPFPGNSIDLVVLPHTLDLAGDPHQTLREVERVLVPEGRVVVLGLNPASLWGVRQRWDRAAARLGLGDPFVPGAAESLGYWRLRDWLRLLSFEVEGGCFGCYRPALQAPSWLGRLRWMESAGDRWWPVLGAVYFLTAVKRVRGMRVIGPAWKTARQAAAPVAVTPRLHRVPLAADPTR